MRANSSFRDAFRSAVNVLLNALAWIGKDPVRTYRREAHYMRGPGPAWRAKHHGH
jgi:hypothetical protein